ncbi:GNAT family N-acetyltransferase [Metabacillus sp. GX 13764]|uniref:GNAT family N-acetyltransferase n=1 Tax=Metabacillus kandeliae TaxID=2900151 RepID=UPI001E563EBD|nr:GNAT family protein [Metabacillus kandeliae]MCD7034887.1 GNAT family N-acetyltransferase [Metabacillus kandeliae]
MAISLDNFYTGKLVKLTAPKEGDAKAMAKWQEDTAYLRNVDTDIAFPRSEASLISREQGGSSSSVFEFRIRPADGEALLGFAAIFGIEWNNRTGTMAIGIGEKSNRGKGYAKESLQLLLRFAFHECSLNRIGLDVISYNEAAINLYKKAGFHEEGRMRQAVLRNGGAYDRIMMGMLREEWEAMLPD